jgi:hypothetical protein
VLKLLPIFLLALIALVFGSPTFAQEAVGPTLEQTINSNSLKAVVIGLGLIAFFVILTVLLKDRYENLKKFLFAGIVAPAIGVSLFLAGSTIYLNQISVTKGPVHWHADFQIWDCGQELDIVDPTGISNKVGTPTLHEHNDRRIHLEGVVVKHEEATLGRFFEVVGGSIAAEEIKIPTTKGLVVRKNGDRCANDNIGILQVYLYRTENDIFTQTKLDRPEEHQLAPFGAVPPGDCLIIEFKDVVEDKTDKLCDSYKLQLLKGKLRGN